MIQIAEINIVINFPFKQFFNTNSDIGANFFITIRNFQMNASSIMRKEIQHHCLSIILMCVLQVCLR